MRAWLLLLAVLAAFKPIVQVASTEDKILPVISLNNNNNNNLNTRADLISFNSFNNLNQNNNNKYFHNQHNNQNNIENLKNSDSEHKSTISNYQNLKIDSITSNSVSNNINNNNNNNNNNNKMVDKKPDPETLVEIESGLLTLFGLKKPPKIDRSKIVIPEAMKQLYAQIMGHEYDSATIPKPGIHTKTANTVRSFTHENSKIDDRFKQHHKFRLFFNINGIPAEEKMKAAELTISRDKIDMEFDAQMRYRVFAYDILKVGIKGKRDPSYLLLDTKIIYLNSSDAISLDVQPAVDRWLAHPKQNHGLLIEVRTAKHLKPAEHNHVRLRRSIDEPHDKWLPKQPLLFTYTDDGRHKPRSLRDTNSRTKRAHHRNGHQRRKHGREQCQRRPLYVDFQDVGWSDWIVAPPGYEAYYCQGDCPFPLADHLNSTNHAVVQTLVNNITPAKVPKACCIPTQLTGISMLYLNDQHTVVLKNYQDMVVVGCGCR